MAYEDLIKKIFRIYPFLLISLFLIFVLVHFLYSTFSPIFIGERKTFYVSPGIKTWLLAQNLEKQGIIRSSFYFRLLATLRK